MRHIFLLALCAAGLSAQTYSVGSNSIPANTLVQLNPVTGLATPLTSGGVYAGIALAGGSPGGSVPLTFSGVIPCVFENATTPGDLVVLGTSTYNDCKDSGSTSLAAIAAGTRVLGTVQNAVAAGSAANVVLNSPNVYGNSPYPAVNPALVSFAPKTFSMIGDSRTAQLNYALTDITSITGFQWFNAANALNGHNMILIGNYGISGDRSDQFLSANLASALTDSAEVLIFNSGCVNDISQAQTGYTSTYGPYSGTAVTSSNVALVCFANMTQAAAQAIGAGKRVIMVSEPGATSLNSASVSAVLEFNERLREWVERTRGAMFFDLAAVLWAPTSSSTAIAFKTGYTIDGTHPNTLGGYYVGKAFAAFIAALIPPYETRPETILDYATNTPTQLITNPLFATLTGGTKGGSGTITGNVPAGYGITAPLSTTSVAVSSAADAAGFGNDVTLTITATAADTVAFYYSPANSLWNSGDIHQASVDVSVAAGSSNMYVWLTAAATLSGGR